MRGAKPKQTLMHEFYCAAYLIESFEAI